MCVCGVMLGIGSRFCFGGCCSCGAGVAYGHPPSHMQSSPEYPRVAGALSLGDWVAVVGVLMQACPCVCVCVCVALGLVALDDGRPGWCPMLVPRLLP